MACLEYVSIFSILKKDSYQIVKFGRQSIENYYAHAVGLKNV